MLINLLLLLSVTQTPTQVFTCELRPLHASLSLQRNSELGVIAMVQEQVDGPPITSTFDVFIMSDSDHFTPLKNACMRLPEAERNGCFVSYIADHNIGVNEANILGMALLGEYWQYNAAHTEKQRLRGYAASTTGEDGMPVQIFVLEFMDEQGTLQGRYVMLGQSWYSPCVDPQTAEY